LLCIAMAGTFALAASKTSAFPLEVKSLSAKITVNTNFDALYTNNVAKPLTKSVNLKQVMTLITNAVSRITGTNAPADVKLCWNPYNSNYMFLTNKSGYYQSIQLNNSSNMYFYAYAYVEDMATSFKLNSKGGGSENDDIIFYLDIYGRDLNTNYFEIYQDYGMGTLSLNASNTNKPATMTITSKGGGYGEIYNSDEGISSGSITFKGSGEPEGDEPYSLWWW